LSLDALSELEMCQKCINGRAAWSPPFDPDRRAYSASRSRPRS